MGWPRRSYPIPTYISGKDSSHTRMGEEGRVKEFAVGDFGSVRAVPSRYFLERTEATDCKVSYWVPSKSAFMEMYC